MDVSTLLTFAVQSGASDLHLSSGEHPMIRLDGDIKKLDLPPFDREAVRAMVYDIMNDFQRKSFEEDLELDFSLELVGVGRFRVNVFMQQHGEGAVFRMIPEQIISLEELGLPPVLGRLCAKERGLVIFTGPTGSGKTTSQAAMIDLINTTSERHIVTIEDPIEFLHKSKKCLVNQRELGTHTHSFARALRAVLREDPDVILVGEMRDLETIRLGITAAETGHLVFATLHSPSTVGSIDRMIDAFPTGQQQQIRTQLSDALESIVAQTLCKGKEKGRVAAIEILIATGAVRNMIRESKTHQIGALMEAGAKCGMQTMDAALRQLRKGGKVTEEEARRKRLAYGLDQERPDLRFAA